MPNCPGLFSINSAFTRTLTIDHTQVPSDQTDFPVLVNFTNGTFKTSANGGHVGSTNAFTFSSDALGTTLYKWEVERYNALTGEIIVWVKIPTVSSSSNTVFYMRYGLSITTDQSDPTNVWTNNFLGGYHLKDGTTLSANSSTGSNNGTINGAVTATTGQIDGGAHISNSSTYIDLGTGMNPAAATLSGWINRDTGNIPPTYAAPLIRSNAGATVFGPVIYVKSTGKLALFVKATGTVSYDGTGSNTLTDGTWYHVAATYDSTNGLVGYVNGSSDGTAAANGAIDTTAVSTWLGIDPSSSVNVWVGSLDEARFSSVARSANWLTCEYNNQKASSTFVTLGPET